MPPNSAKSPFQSNTMPPPSREHNASLDKEFADMKIRPAIKTTFPCSDSQREDSGRTPSCSKAVARSHASKGGGIANFQNFKHCKKIASQSNEKTATTPTLSHKVRNQLSCKDDTPRHTAAPASCQSKRERLSTQHQSQISDRVRTSMYPLGDNTRTYLEGMMPGSENSQRSSYQAGAATQSMLTSPDDIKMASRQTRIETMAPSERQAQEAWAQSIIQRTSSCPSLFAWMRIHGGYHCQGGSHLITDELLSEGKGGLMVVLDPLNPEDHYGPFYRDPNDPSLFLYAGKEPRPPCIPDSFLGAVDYGASSLAYGTPGASALWGGPSSMYGGSRFASNRSRRY
jgi:hypothetical protein